jgi:translocation and assembly module TamB
VRLLGPTRIDLAKGLAIDRLRLGADGAVLDLAGRIAPQLDATLSLRDLTSALVQPFLPGVAARGVLSADAKLTGSLSAPAGSIRVAGRDLQLAGATTSAIAPASLDAQAELAGGAMQLDLRLASGRAIAMTIDGRAPLTASGAVDLRAKGTLDLAVLDPVLTAGGRRVQGQVTVDAAMAGSVAAPRITGSARLANGEIRDFTQGLRLTGVSARIEAAGDTLTLAMLEADAGPGKITAKGTIAVRAEGMPVSVAITARNARPVASDLLTATLDADLTLRGKPAERLDLSGHVQVHRADINIPDSFPPSVAVLNVRRPGAPPPSPPVGPELGLDIAVDAPEQIFVRGHGLDAEMGGRLAVGGTVAAPRVADGFDLRQGTFSLASATLKFTRGRVSFDGTGPAGKLDPTLNFAAESASATLTATLAVTGHADTPKIVLSSTPELPPDEVLAQLLFGQSVKQLSPLQLAGIAQAVASLTGVGGGLDPIGSIRKGLGLDRLAAGSDSSGSGASVQAGKYVAKGVYVGAQQGTSGDTHAQVQIDLTKHLKVETVIGTGGAAPATGITPDNDPGSRVGLTYQLEY